MNLCDDNHEEVCYDGCNCPVCKAIENLTAAENDLATAEAKIDTLQEKIEALENEAASA